MMDFTGLQVGPLKTKLLQPVHTFYSQFECFGLDPKRLLFLYCSGPARLFSGYREVLDQTGLFENDDDAAERIFPLSVLEKREGPSWHNLIGLCG